MKTTAKKFIYDCTGLEPKWATYGDFGIVCSAFLDYRYLTVLRGFEVMADFKISIHDWLGSEYVCSAFSVRGPLVLMIEELLNDTADRFVLVSWNFLTWKSMDLFMERLIDELKRLSRKGGS